MPPGNPQGYLTPGYLASFFEQNPSYAYHSYNDRWGSGEQGNYYRNAMSEVLNLYHGTVGRALQNLQEPDFAFTDFLRDFDWRANYLSKAPADRRFGGNLGSTAPVLNWLV